MSSLMRLSSLVSRFTASTHQRTNRVAVRTSRSLSTQLENAVPVRRENPRRMWNADGRSSLAQQFKPYLRTEKITYHVANSIIESAEEQAILTPSECLLLLQSTGSRIRNMKPSDRLALTERVWKIISNKNLDISHYNAWFLARIENEEDIDPLKFLQELELKNLMPNRVTFQIVIQQFCRLGDLENAKKILDFMKKEHIAVTEGIFNSFIIAHGQAKDMDSAFGIVEIMRSMSVEPSSETYTCLAMVLANNGKLPRCRDLIRDQSLDLSQVLRVITAGLQAGHKDVITTLLGRVENERRSSQLLLNTATELLLSDHVNEAVEIMGKAAASDEEAPELVFFVNDYLACVDDKKEAIGKLCDVSTRMASVAFQKIIYTPLSVGDVQACFDWFKFAHEKEIPMRSTYFMPLLAMTRTETEVMKVMKLMSTCSPELFDEYQLFPFFLEKLSSESPKEVLTKLLRTGCPSGYAVKHLLNALLLNGELKNAAALLEGQSLSRSDFSHVKTLNECERMGKILTLETIPAAITILQAFGEARPMYCAPFVEAFVLKAQEELLPSIADAILKSSLSVTQNTLNYLQEHSIDVSALKERIPDSTATRFSERLNLRSKMNEELEEALEKDGSAQKEALRRELTHRYLRAGETKKASELFEKSDRTTMNSGDLATGLTLYIREELPDKAFELLKSLDPTFPLKPSIYVRLAECFMKNKRRDEALNVLSLIPPHASLAEVQNESIRLVNATFNHFGVDETYKLIRDHIPRIAEVHRAVSNRLLDMTIDVDIRKAVKLFQKFLMDMNLSVNRSTLLQKLIEKDDQVALAELRETLLQKFSEEFVEVIFGTVYAKCGMITKAKEHLRQVPSGMLIYNLRKEGEFLVKFPNSYGTLEKILEAYSNVCPSVTAEVYKLRVKLCKEKGDADGILELWVKAQEESVLLSDRTLQWMADMLMENQTAIPFAVRDPASVGQIRLPKNFDVDKELNELRDMVGRDEVPRDFLRMAFRALDKLIEDKDVEKVRSFVEFCDSKNFEHELLHSKLYKALMTTNRAAEVVDILEKDIQKGRTFIKASLVCEILRKFPDLSERVMKLAQEANGKLEANVPLTAFITRLIVQNSTEEIESILEKFPIAKNIVDVRYVERCIRQTDAKITATVVALCKKYCDELHQVTAVDLHLRTLIAQRLIEEARSFLAETKSESASIYLAIPKETLLNLQRE